jgi:uncharacterized protein YkwD
MEARPIYGMRTLRGRNILMASVAIYLAMLMFGSNFSYATVDKQPQKVATIQLTDEEQRFTDLVNNERLSKGLKTLQLDPLLVEISRSHSKEMADKSYFDHFSPTPGQRTALDRYLSAVKHRPVWALVGENLFYCSIVDVNRGHECLMDSRSHRENILNSRFEKIGVGVYKDDTGQFWVTEMFLSSVD